MTSASDHFPSDTKGLQEAGAPESVELADTDQFDLRIAPVAKKLGEATVRMLAYNGLIPGPTLRVRQGSELTVEVTNEGDLEDRALARAAAGECLRRNAGDAGTHADRR